LHILAALDPDGLSDVSTIDWEGDLGGDDVDDIGVLHSMMATAGFNAPPPHTVAAGEGGGGRKGRERSVLDHSWRVRCGVPNEIQTELSAHKAAVTTLPNRNP
jgi:hypothetical protein